MAEEDPEKRRQAYEIRQQGFLEELIAEFHAACDDKDHLATFLTLATWLLSAGLGREPDDMTVAGVRLYSDAMRAIFWFTRHNPDPRAERRVLIKRLAERVFGSVGAQIEGEYLRETMANEARLDDRQRS